MQSLSPIALTYSNSTKAELFIYWEALGTYRAGCAAFTCNYAALGQEKVKLMFDRLTQ